MGSVPAHQHVALIPTLLKFRFKKGLLTVGFNF